MWLVAVISAAIYMFLTRHIGTSISFIFVVIGTIYFEFMILFRRTAMRVLYWSVKVAIICLFIGFIAGYSILMGNLPFMDIPYYNVVIEKKADATEKNSNTKAPWKGRLIFTGANGVLIYDEPAKQVRLIRWDSITEMCGKPGDINQCGGN